MSKSFGDLIHDARMKKEWTQRELIAKIEQKEGKKLSPSYITHIERGGVIPSPDVIFVLSEVLGIDLLLIFTTANKEKVDTYKNKLEEKYGIAKM